MARVVHGGALPSLPSPSLLVTAQLVRVVLKKLKKNVILDNFVFDFTVVVRIVLTFIWSN